MSRPTTIDIALLREEITRTLDIFLARGVGQVELESDYYWEFGWEERHRKPGDSVEPPKVAIGSLADDLEFVLSARDGGRVPPVLCHMAPLLNYLGVKAGDHGVFVEEE